MTTAPAAKVSHYQYCPEHVITAQNHVHQTDPPASLRIPCAPDVAVQATGSHTVGAAVAHKPSGNQKAPRKSKVAIATTASNVAAEEQMW